MTMSRLITGLGAAAFAAALFVPTMADASVADFYKGKRMIMYIGYSAGGGYDRYARLVARHIGQYIPGNPKFVSKNMTGAGGLRLANALYNTLNQDGSVMAIMSRQASLEPLKGNKKAQFEANKYNWIGSTNQEYSLCAFWHTSPIKTIDDLFNQNPIVGGTGVGSGTDMQAMMLNNLIGTKLHLISGYPGGVDINLAMERGEVHGRCAWSWSSVLATQYEWLQSKKVIFPIQITLKPNPDPRMKGVPTIMDYIKNDLDRKAVEMILAPLTMGRPFAVGPKVPKDRVKALRVAFMTTMTDKEYVRESKRARLPINPVSGKDVQALVDKLYAYPADVIKRMGEAISKTNNIRISKAVIKTYVHKGKITKVKRDGRRVSWKGGGKKGKLRVSGRGTKITVGGKKAKRKALKVGMSCTFTVKGAQKAKKIDCE